jgi:hypothetical protein
MNEVAESMPSIIRLARGAAWAPLGVLVLHEVGARLLGHEPFVDPTMHFLGGMATTFFLRYGASLADRWVGTPTEAALDLLVFGLTCAVALFWEFGEFAADEYFGTHVQRGLGNTIRDLALGVVGSIVYILARRQIGVWHKPAVQ